MGYASRYLPNCCQSFGADQLVLGFYQLVMGILQVAISGLQCLLGFPAIG